MEQKIKDFIICVCKDFYNKSRANDEDVELYNRPFGQILVPESYSTQANDGMIFGIMEGNNFKVQNLLCGVCFTYKNTNSYSSYYSEALFRAGDKSFMWATSDSDVGEYRFTCGYGSGKNIFNGAWYFGEGNTSSYMTSFLITSGNNLFYYGGLYGNWYVVGNLYFREDNSSSGNGYISHVTQNSSVYAYLGGTWYAQEIYYGSYGSYRVRVDGDQVTWYWRINYYETNRSTKRSHPIKSTN